MQAFFTVLPMAFVMSAGPQIVSATFFATSDNPKVNSLAFLGGVATATTIGVLAFYFLGGGSDERGGGGDDWLDWVIVGGLILLIVWLFVKRKESHPPKWMGKLQAADAGFAAKLGFLLYVLMPTDLISMLTVGAFVARENEPWWHCLGFVALTVLIAGLPFLALLVMGRRAETLLPALRNWMNANSWIVSEAVLLFFLVMALT
jgi:cytochrome c biogenesis protein CcdA